MNFRSRPTESLKAQPFRDTANQEHLFQRNANELHYQHTNGRPLEVNFMAAKKPMTLAQHLHAPPTATTANNLKSLKDLVKQSPQPATKEPTNLGGAVAREQRRQPQQRQRVSFFDGGREERPAKSANPPPLETSSWESKQPSRGGSPVKPLAPRPTPHWSSDHFKSTYQELGQSPDAFATRAKNLTVKVGTTAIDYSKGNPIPEPISTDIGQAPNAFATRAPNASLHRGTNCITYEY